MSSINTGSINANFPVSKANNSSQGFRDNFAAIKTNLNTAASEITTLQTNVTTLQTTVDNLSQPDTAEVLTAVSGSDTIIATSGKIFAAYATGQRFQFKPSTANTTSSVTININSKGAKSIKYSDATDLPIGSLTTSQWITIEYDGTNFVILGSSGFTQSGTGAVVRTVQNKLRDVISVKDFGAIGNGIANDAIALQAALTAGAGRAVYFPGGTYLTNATLTVPADTTVYGDGYASVVYQNTRERNVFVLNNNCTVQNLRLQGDGVTSGGASFGLNNGIYALSKRNIKILNCFLHSFEFNGVYIDDCDNVEILGNYVWGNAYSNSTSADILIYGQTGGSSRINISKNFCFSNNSQGIFVDALGVDSDILVEGNVCTTLDAITWQPISVGALLRRHGIMIGYNGASGRYVVVNNICRRTRQTGIYYQGATASVDGVQIIGNQCTSNGINALEPSLASGIYVATQGDGDIIANNLIEDFSEALEFGAAGIKIAPAAASAVSSFAHTLISNNVIRSSAGHGILLTSYAINCEIQSNIVHGSARSDICWVPSAGLTDVGSHTIKNNRVERATANKPAIELDFQSSTGRVYVIGNNLVGLSYLVNSANNSGIKWPGNPPITVSDNAIYNFYHGVYQSNYITGRAFSQQIIDRNTFNTCTNGIMIAGTTTAPVLPVQDNIFLSCVTKASGAALGADVVYIAQRFGDKIYFQSNSIPTIGTWAVGDRVFQLTPVVGQPKGWVCTVAGSPGTWVSEGNL